MMIPSPSHLKLVLLNQFKLAVWLKVEIKLNIEVTVKHINFYVNYYTSQYILCTLNFKDRQYTLKFGYKTLGYNDLLVITNR